MTPLFGRSHRSRTGFDYEFAPHDSDGGRGFVVVRGADGSTVSWDDFPEREGLRNAVVVLSEGAEDALQDDAFAPGTQLSLYVEGRIGDEAPRVGVWDDERTKQIGYLPSEVASVVGGAVLLGEKYICRSACEDREGDRRVGLRVVLIREGSSFGA